MQGIRFEGDIRELREGIAILLPDLGLIEDPQGICVTVRQADGARLTVCRDGGCAEIVCDRRIHFFRALGLLAEHRDETQYRIEEPVHFTMNGVMFDVTQSNTMMNADHARMLLRRMAVMGLNMMMLYNEDGYELPDWPYFGHMRARFTREELSALDDYAFALGIELIPCIQTLAHLTEPLKWPCFAGMRENGATLLPGDERVYRFIEDMITAASAPFRTKRIHIGMDEAMNLGMGTYFKQHGLTDAGDIMMRHLERVMEILRRHGLQPMLWCDMFFKRAFGKYSPFQQEYGNMNAEYQPCTLPDGSIQMADRGFLERFPKDAQLVNYCYTYRPDDEYDRRLNLGKLFGTPPVFAGGIWGWTSFCPNWRLSFGAAVSGLAACKRNGYREVFATTWGDEQTECPVDALLLGMQLYAEIGYSDELDMDKLIRRYRFVTGADYAATRLLEELDDIPGCPEGNPDNFNASKCLLWQDPLCGMFDRDLEGMEDEIEAHYRRLSETFAAESAKPSDLQPVFALSARLAAVLADKATLGCRLKAAYDVGDRAALKRYAETVLPRLIEAETALYEYHRAMFFARNKAFGWETFDLRHSAMLGRLRTAKWRLEQYLSGAVTDLDELREPKLYIHGSHKLKLHLCYPTMISASRFASTCGYPISG